jgi:diguanylate cyclase (GGDEF)-like protein
MNIKRLENATILVVDDNPKNLQVLLDYLKESGFRPLIARNGEGALRQAEFAKPDLILLDVIMPSGIDGFETCRRLKAYETTKEIPVIFLTALSDAVDKIKGIEAGGADYVTKPFNGLELLARIETHLELSRYRKELKQTNRELRQANESLLESRKQLELAAKTDPLTQLPNRREMLDRIQYEKTRFERNQKVFTLALCDIDDFKRVNDISGHDCGDFILVSISCLMRSMVRKQDHLARWGGEEFLFAFPETDFAGSRIICEKIRKRIAEHVFQYQDQQLSITITFGASVFTDYSMDIEACLKKADQALYKGKEQGKNCTVLFEEEEK